MTEKMRHELAEGLLNILACIGNVKRLVDDCCPEHEGEPHKALYKYRNISYHMAKASSYVDLLEIEVGRSFYMAKSIEDRRREHE